MPGKPREEILACLRAKVAADRPIIGGDAGMGLSARFEKAGGADLTVIYNSGRYHMVGRGSLARLLAYGSDPFMLRDHSLDEMIGLGFAGMQNFPTVGLIDGKFRANLKETGMGYDLEVELIRAARSKEMQTTPYVFAPAEAAAVAKAGADVIVAHMGLTTGGDIGAETALALNDCPALIDAMDDAARQIRDDVIVLYHGGPISSPEDAAFVLKHCTKCHGFYGASSMERLPSERALTTQMQASVNIGKE